MLPYRNIRDLLGLHAKVSPHKHALVTYDKNGQTETLSYLELVGKSHQIANLLFEDLGVKRGDTIAYLGANHENLLLLHCAAWVLGAGIVPMDSPAYAESGAAFAFVRHEDYATALTKQIPSLEGIIQIGGESQPNVLRLEELAAHRPTTFLGDESGAKGADIPVIAANERSARLDDCALFAAQLSQGDLLLAAQTYAQTYALTGNQTSICALPLSNSSSFVASLFAALFLGGTSVLLEAFEPALFWRTVVKERANTATLTAAQISQLVAYADANEATGQTIFGQKITLQDAKHFRFIICLDKTLSVELARAFEERFGLPIQYGYAPHTQLIASLPLSLAWREHQTWLHGDTVPSIGLAIPPYQLAVLDEAGAILLEATQGHLAYRLSPDSAWQITEERAFYRLSPENQAYFFLA